MNIKPINVNELKKTFGTDVVIGFKFTAKNNTERTFLGRLRDAIEASNLESPHPGDEYDAIHVSPKASKPMEEPGTLLIAYGQWKEHEGN